MLKLATKCLRNFMPAAAVAGLVVAGLMMGALVATEPMGATATSADNDCAEHFCTANGSCKRDPEGGTECRLVADGNGYTCETYDCEY